MSHFRLYPPLLRKTANNQVAGRFARSVSEYPFVSSFHFYPIKKRGTEMHML